MKIEWISLCFLRYTLSRGKLLWVFLKTPYFKVSLGAFPLISFAFYAILRLVSSFAFSKEAANEPCQLRCDAVVNY